MRIKLISIGREKADPAEPLVRDYLARIARQLPIEAVVLRPDRPDRLSARIEREARRCDLVAALDERGRALDSRQFADLIASWMNRGLKEVAFLLGGAEGLPEPVKAGVSLKLSLSRMTLPHRLARLLLAEQIYRGLSIIHGSPYQK